MPAAVKYMALARIICRSQECSRELALDLLARGYAVEIVSPDAIPDNIADLELRVDSGPSDLLTANVHTHNGAHSTSLEFVHHLKAPMVDFKRRPPETEIPFFARAAPISFKPEKHVVDNAAARATEDAKLLAAKVPVAVIPKTPEPARPVPPSPPASVQAAPRIALPQPLQTVSKKPEELNRLEGLKNPEELKKPEELSSPGELQKSDEHRKPVMTLTIHRSNPTHKTKSKPKPIRRDEGWIWRAAATFAGVVLVALVLGFGMRRGGAASVSNSAVSNFKDFASEPQTETGGRSSAPSAISGQALARPAVTAVATMSDAATASKHLAPPASAPNRGKNGKAKSARASNESSLPKLAAATPSRRHKPSRSHGDDLIAPDTIIYFDQPGAQPTLAKKLNQHGASSPKKSAGVIAASRVNAKTIPKAASGK